MSRYRSLATALRRQTAAVARRSAEPGSPVSGLVDAYRSSTDNLRGSSDGLTDSVQRLSRLTDAITVIDLASASGRDVAETAAFFDDLRSTLGTETLSSAAAGLERSEEHTSELQSLMRISYAVFCLKKKKINTHTHDEYTN